jgi:hypothetical protein
LQQHVRAEVDVTAQNLIRTFARVDDLVAGRAHRAAEQELRQAVTVVKERFSVPDRVGEMVRQVGLSNRDGAKICSGPLRHLASDVPFVVGRLIEGEREGLNGRVRLPRSKAEHRARVEPAAQVTAHRHVGAHPQAHRFFEDGGEFFHVRALVPRAGGEFGSGGVVEFPVAPQPQAMRQWPGGT